MAKPAVTARTTNSEAASRPNVRSRPSARRRTVFASWMASTARVTRFGAVRPPMRASASERRQACRRPRTWTSVRASTAASMGSPAVAALTRAQARKSVAALPQPSESSWSSPRTAASRTVTTCSTARRLEAADAVPTATVASALAAPCVRVTASARRRAIRADGRSLGRGPVLIRPHGG